MATGDILVLKEQSDGSYIEVTKIQAEDSDVQAGTSNVLFITPKLLRDNDIRPIPISATAPSSPSTYDLWIDIG